MSKFLSPRLASLTAYTAGEQPVNTTGAGNTGKPGRIKLNTNESPYPPSPGVLSAIGAQELSRLNLYPSPDGTELIQKLAGLYGLTSDNIILGNGSDELLAFAFLAFFESGVVFPDITYGFYPIYADLYVTPYEQIPLTDDFCINTADYIGNGKNIVLANPNAPTGIALPLCDIEAIAESNPNHIILIDEAYVDFGTESAVPLINKNENLLVIHTFSKARSMAGLRLAYAMASAPVISDMNKMKYSFNPYNVDRLAQVIGIAALGDNDYYKEKQREIVETREYSAARLRELGFEMTDSSANFLFAKSNCIGGAELYLKLKEKDILVRHWDAPRIKDYVRITVGTRAQMDELFQAITEILP